MAPHLLLVGRTGSGKTTAARYIVDYLCIRRARARPVILDWDGEYAGYLALPVLEPPFPLPLQPAPPLPAPQPSLPPQFADAVAEVERAEEGGHMIAAILKRVLLQEKTLNDAVRRLRIEARDASSWLRGILEAAAVRLETVAKYVILNVEGPEPEGVFLLAAITSIWERAALQQFISVYFTFTKNGQVPALLVIEEGGMGARTTFLKHLMAHARRRNVKVVFVSQTMPPAEIRQNFEVLLFDTDWETRRTLKAPILDSPLKPGECWWVRRAERPLKFRFPSR
jgi:DNA polymerase III delta prime subunit